MKPSFIPMAALSLLITSPLAAASQTIIQFKALKGTYTESTPSNPNDFTNNVGISIKFKSDSTHPLVQQTDDAHFKVNREGLYSVTCSLVLQNNTTGRPFDGRGGSFASHLRVNEKEISRVTVDAFGGSTTPAGFNYLGTPVTANLYLTKDDIFMCSFEAYGTGNFANQHELCFDTDESFIQVRPLFPFDSQRQEL